MKTLILLSVLFSASSSFATCTKSQLINMSKAGAKSLYTATFAASDLKDKAKVTYTVNAPAAVSTGDNKVLVVVNRLIFIKKERVEYSRGYEAVIQSFEDTPCDLRSVTLVAEAG